MPRSHLSAVNIVGGLTLNAVAGTNGQILTSGGTGTNPTWSSSFSGFLSTTNTGRTGLISFITPGSSSQATWANYPVGLGTMIASSQGSNGAPNNNFQYFFKVANRDFGGGWGGISIDYATGDFFVGRANESSNYATWHKLANTSLENTFTVGGQRIENAVAGVIPLVLRGASGQTADLTQWQNNAGASQAKVRSDGFIETLAGLSATGNYLNSFGGATLANTILAVRPGASNIGLVVRGAASQTANLQEWQDSTGATLTRIASDGSLIYGRYSGSGFSTNTGAAFIITNNSAIVPMTVKGAAGQSSSLQEWQNSGGTVLASVSSAGALTAAGLTLSSTTSPITLNGSVGTSGQVLTSQGAGATPTWTTISGTGTVTSITAGTNGLTGGTITTSGTIDIDTAKVPRLTTNTNTFGASSGATTFVVKQGPTQGTTNLMEWRTSDGTTVTGSVRYDGNVINFGGVEASYYMTATAGTSTNVPMTVYGKSDHTANIQEWRKLGEGSPRAAIDQYGDLYLPGSAIKIGTTYLNSKISIAPGAAESGIVIRGSSGQSGNLQEWQNNTPATVASVSPTGAFTTVGNIAINNGTSTALTTTGATASIFNTSATTVNLAGAATTLNIGTGNITKTINIGTTGTSFTTVNIGTSGTSSSLINLQGATINVGRATSSTGSITGENTFIAGASTSTSGASATVTGGSLRIMGGSATQLDEFNTASIQGGDVYVDGGSIGSVSGTPQTKGRIYIGTTTDSGSVTVGRTGVVSTFPGGITTAGTLTRSVLNNGGTTGATFNNAGDLIRTPSSERYKQNIRDAAYSYEDILSLQPKIFRLKDEVIEDENAREYAGFIAEDLDQIESLKVFVNYQTQEDGSKIPDGIAYAEMVSALVSAIKYQDARIQALEAQVQALSE
jgi:hypothetical protein